MSLLLLIGLLLFSAVWFPSASLAYSPSWVPVFPFPFPSLLKRRSFDHPGHIPFCFSPNLSPCHPFPPQASDYHAPHSSPPAEFFFFVICGCFLSPLIPRFEAEGCRSDFQAFFSLSLQKIDPTEDLSRFNIFFSSPPYWVLSFLEVLETLGSLSPPL